MKTLFTFNKVTNDAGQLAFTEGHAELTSSPRVTPRGLLSFKGEIVKTAKQLIRSKQICKVKPLKNESTRQQNYLVVTVEQRKNWSGANNGTTCYIYTKWKQTEDGFVYTLKKGSRKFYDSIDAAFEAAGIGKTVPFYNYLDSPSVGSHKKIISQDWGSDLYKASLSQDWDNRVYAATIQPRDKKPSEELAKS